MRLTSKAKPGKLSHAERGRLGGRARAKNQTKAERSALASKGGKARWKKLSKSERSAIAKDRWRNYAGPNAH